MANTLGDRLRDLRKEKGYTLDQLADLSGSSKSYIWELENKNPPRPSAEKLSRIADVLGTTIDFLLGQETLSRADSADAHFYRDYQSRTAEEKQKLRDMADLLWGKK
jgi:transcriptional regulator with XRE-family HTH domain